MSSAAFSIEASLALADAGRSRRAPPREEFGILHSLESNALSGSTLTLRETAFIVKERLTVPGRSIRLIAAALGCASGFEAAVDLAEERPELSEALILKLHGHVVRGSPPPFCGRWRERDVSPFVASPRPAPWREIPERIRAFLNGGAGRGAFCIRSCGRRAFMSSSWRSIRSRTGTDASGGF